MPKWIDSIIKKAKKTLTTDYSKNFPQAQAVWLSKPGNVIMLYPYGTAGNAPLNSYMIMFNPGGQEEERVCIEFDIDSMPKDVIQDEFICGNFVAGSTVKFNQNGDITITGTANVIANITGNMTATIGGNLNTTVTGTSDLTATGAINITSSTSITLTAPTIDLN